MHCNNNRKYKFPSLDYDFSQIMKCDFPLEIFLRPLKVTKQLYPIPIIIGQIKRLMKNYDIQINCSFFRQ